jgi:hypothetical protein
MINQSTHQLCTKNADHDRDDHVLALPATHKCSQIRNRSRRKKPDHDAVFRHLLRLGSHRRPMAGPVSQFETSTLTFAKSCRWRSDREMETTRSSTSPQMKYVKLLVGNCRSMTEFGLFSMKSAHQPRGVPPI